MNLFSQRHGRDAVGLCMGASFFLKRLALVIYTHTHTRDRQPVYFLCGPTTYFFLLYDKKKMII